MFLCVWSHLGQTLGVCLMKSQGGQVRQCGLVQPLRSPLLIVLLLLLLLQLPQDPLQHQLPHFVLRALQQTLQELARQLTAPPELRDLHASAEGHPRQAEQVLGAARPKGGRGRLRDDQL